MKTLQIVGEYLTGEPKLEMVEEGPLPYIPPTPSPIDDEVEKAAKVASQWPKTHGCTAGSKFAGRILTFEDIDDWRARTTLYDDKDRDDFCSMEHRNCECGGTMTVVTVIHDLKEE